MKMADGVQGTRYIWVLIYSIVVSGISHLPTHPTSHSVSNDATSADFRFVTHTAIGARYMAKMYCIVLLDPVSQQTRQSSSQAANTFFGHTNPSPIKSSIQVEKLTDISHKCGSARSCYATLMPIANPIQGKKLNRHSRGSLYPAGKPGTMLRYSLLNLSQVSATQLLLTFHLAGH